MKRTSIGIVVCILVLIANSCNQNKKVTNESDYDKYIQSNVSNSKLNYIDSEIAFWNKRFEKSPGDVIASMKIASFYSKRFAFSGNISEIHFSDSLYKKVNALVSKNSSGVFRSLAANCIIQHRFRQARLYIDSALKLGDDKYATMLILFDVSFELGDYKTAENVLFSMNDKNQFDYLIRQSKWVDHINGNLEKAIEIMETAFEKIKSENNEELYCWTLSNLADLYSHAGKFEIAYRYYLTVLEKNPKYFHCLKGIAWLAFSHDKNTKEAKEILNYLYKNHPVPDYKLMLYQIAVFEKNNEESAGYLAEYQTAVSDKQYGDMYNKYNFYLLADILNKQKEAMEIATREVKNRPTYESYNLLAWACFQSGQKEKAHQIADDWLENKCFEPDAMFHLGEIFLASGKRDAGQKYLKQALTGSYELGPFYEGKIKMQLDAL